MDDDEFLARISECVDRDLAVAGKCKCRRARDCCEVCRLLELSDEIQTRQIARKEQEKEAAKAIGGQRSLIEDLP